MNIPRQLRYGSAPAVEAVAAVPFNPDHDAQAMPGLSIVQILTIARAYWKPAMALAATIIVLTAVMLKFLPKTYQATATLIVNTENKDPLAGPFPVESLGNFVTTQTELMTSPVILLGVVDKLNLTQDREYSAGIRSTDPVAIRDYVEQNLAKALVIETGRGGQLLYISVLARSPVKAADIANAVADVYLEQQRKRISQPAGERAQRYSEELAELRAKAAAAQDKVTEYRRRNGLTDVNTSRDDSASQSLTNLQTKLLDAQNLRRSLEAKRTGQQGSTDEALASGQISALKTQISDLEGQLAQKRPTLGARHPVIVELTSRLESTRRSLATAVAALSENNSTELSRARELEDKLERAVAEQRQKVLGFHQLEDEEQKLMVELESAQAVYKRALDGYDQIMFASVGNYTNVSIIARATVPLKPSKPNKLKLLAIGVIFGLGIGLAVPVAYELFVNRRVRCRDDIERDFGIPVLAHFGSLPTPSAGAA